MYCPCARVHRHSANLSGLTSGVKVLHHGVHLHSCAERQRGAPAGCGQERRCPQTCTNIDTGGCTISTLRRPLARLCLRRCPSTDTLQRAAQRCLYLAEQQVGGLLDVLFQLVRLPGRVALPKACGAGDPRQVTTVVQPVPQRHQQAQGPFERLHTDMEWRLPATPKHLRCRTSLRLPNRQ